MGAQKIFVDYITEDLQSWEIDETTGELLHPTDRNSEAFSIYERDDGSIFGISPKTKEIIQAVLAEYIDITGTKGEEPKKKQ